MVLFAVLGGLGWAGRLVWKQVSPTLFGNRREETIPTARAKNANIIEEVVAVGRIRAVFSTELRSEVNGRIMKIAVRDGQTLTRGDEILRLDQQDLLTQLQESDRSIEAARLRTERAQRDFDRQNELQVRGLIPNKDFEDARITLALSVNDAAIAESRNANLRDKLAKTVIRAPHAGVLLLRDLTEGQVITGVGGQSGGTLLGEVADLSGLMIRTNVNEIDVARLKLEDRSRVRIDSLRGVFVAGTIKRIATSATESPNDRTRLFPVDVVLDQTDDRLRPGMSATVTFTLSRADNTLSLPLTAVFSNADSVRYVFRRTATGHEVRVIETGIADTRRIQVLAGLDLADEIALTRPLTFDGEVPVVGASPTTVPAKPAPSPTR